MMQYSLEPMIRFAVLVLSALLLAWPMSHSGRRTMQSAAHAVPSPIESGGLRAAVHYVSPNGSDSDSGSQSYPFATIQHADRVVQPGDTVVVLNGTYSGDILLQSSGTAASPITYVAQNKWQAKLVGTTSGDGTAVIRVTGGHLIIKNFDITGKDAAGILLASSGTTASHNQAIGNYVHDLVTPCDSDGGSALNTGGGNDYSGISHDDFIGNLVVNIHPPSGCTANTSAGIYEAVPYGVVANNIVMNVGGAAIQSWHNAYHETFFGNVAMNSKDGIVVGDGDAPGGVTNDYTLVQNNITINNSYCGICEDGLTGTHNIYTDNLSYGNHSNILLLNGLAATGTITADPQFVDNTCYWRLPSTIGLAHMWCWGRNSRCCH